MTALSVIIPVYNTEKYITECLESIYSQNFYDFEVICVNDGSTDTSLDKLQIYQKRHSDLIIIDKANEGSGVARNLALKKAKGDYILFADSDDRYLDGAFNEIIKKINNTNIEILIFGALTSVKEKPRTGHYSVEKIPKIFKNKEFDNKDLEKSLFRLPSTAWSKVYKREFLEKYNIRFQEIKEGQDQIFFVKSMINASKMAVLSKNLYCYRKNRCGSVTSVKTKHDILPVLIFYEIEKVIRNLNKNYKYLILDRYLKKAIIRLAKTDYNYRTEYYVELVNLLKHIRKTYPDRWQVGFLPSEKDNYILLKFKLLIVDLLNRIFLFRHVFRQG